jgi:hypothetical protein
MNSSTILERIGSDAKPFILTAQGLTLSVLQWPLSTECY